MSAKSFSERVTVCEMSAREIMDFIPQAVLEAVRARDPHPCFVAWEVGRTGFSTGRLGEAGSVKKFWSSEVVRELAEAGNARPAIQVDHSAGASRPRRVGEILRGIARRVGEAVRALWIGYIEDRETARAIRRNELPSCSIEGMVDVRESGEMGVEVVGVPAMRALALAGPEATPGFEEAGVLAVVQETSQGEEQKVSDAISLRGVRRFIEENGVRADELYPAEALASLPVIADLVRNEVGTALESLDLAKVAEGKGKMADAVRKLREERDVAVRELAERRVVEAAREIRAKALAHPLLFGVQKSVAVLIAGTLNVGAISGAQDEAAAIDREVRAAVERAREAGVEIPFGAKPAQAAQGGVAAGGDVESVTPGASAKDYTKPENNALIPSMEDK
jgi:hypothetical protein